MRNRKEIEKLIREDAEFTLSPSLKESIMEKASNVVPDIEVKKTKRHAGIRYIRQIAALAAIFVFAITGVCASVGLYNEEYESIYIDVNPSVELVVNRFDKVNKVICYNADAEALVADLSLKGKNAEECVRIILDKLSEKNYITEENEVYISTYSKKEEKNGEFLKKVNSDVKKYSDEKGYDVKINGNTLTKQDKKNAKDSGLSPMKYKLVSSIIEKDGSYTIENLKDLSMKNLKDIYSSLYDTNR